MRNQTFLLIAGIVVAGLFAGCDGSKSSESGQATPSQTEAALNTAASESKKVMNEAAATVVESAKATAADVSAKFVTMAKAQGDNILNSIGQDLSTKAKALLESCGVNPTIQTNVEKSLTAMVKGNDGEALAPAFELSTVAGLTEPQLQLAKEVGNLASAFVVQRNFSALSGAQGDVATLVSSLREGQYAATLAPLKNIINNASLTPAQKEMIGSIADKYAPGIKQAAGTLQQGLQGLQNLPGVKK